MATRVGRMEDDAADLPLFEAPEQSSHQRLRHAPASPLLFHIYVENDRFRPELEPAVGGSGAGKDRPNLNARAPDWRGRRAGTLRDPREVLAARKRAPEVSVGQANQGVFRRRR